jgi:hypothetical protein
MHEHFANYVRASVSITRQMYTRRTARISNSYYKEKYDRVVDGDALCSCNFKIYNYIIYIYIYIYIYVTL